MLFILANESHSVLSHFVFFCTGLAVRLGKAFKPREQEVGGPCTHLDLRVIGLVTLLKGKALVHECGDNVCFFQN